MKWTMEFSPRCLKWALWFYVVSFLLQLMWVPFYYSMFGYGFDQIRKQGVKWMECEYGLGFYAWMFAMLLHSFNFMVAFGLYGESYIFDEQVDTEVVWNTTQQWRLLILPPIWPEVM